jgi:hypothetical protein
MRHDLLFGRTCGTMSWDRWLARNPGNAATYAPEDMAGDFNCLGVLGTNGCGFEQQLKAMRRSLAVNALPGRCNDGFLRNDSLLALLFVTDEEDCSVRPDHPEMFDETRDLGNLNIRCFLHPEFVEPVEDYVAAFRALRPTGAKNVFLSMIVGVPPDSAECIGFGDQVTRCLDTAQMETRIDPAMTTQLVPSCNTDMGIAFPPRRFVQLAVAWGKNAYVDSICKTDWRDAMRAFAGRLQENLSNNYFCLADAPPFDGPTCTSTCRLIELLDEDRPCAEDPLCPAAWCPAGTADEVDRLAPCRDPSTSAECVPLKRDVGLTDVSGYPRRQCLVRQVPRDAAAVHCGTPLGAGWYYQPPEWAEHLCPELVFAAESAEPLLDRSSGAYLRCPGTTP